MFFKSAYIKSNALVIILIYVYIELQIIYIYIIIQIQLLEYKVFYDGGVIYDWFFLTSFMDSLRLWSDLVDVIYMLWFFITAYIIL